MTMIQAYAWEGLTFCPSCAVRASNVGLMLVGLPQGETMNEVIATMVIHQQANNLPVVTPVAVTAPERPDCESCGRRFEGSEAA